MARNKKETNRVDQPLDDLLTDYQSPEGILVESGLLKQKGYRCKSGMLPSPGNHF